ncbi:WD40 repeat domain-containing protein, partial [Klebsiella pneumoniae]|uniref:WD40 repeat domain-containing protein n=1 Tax=Klebsiella pneumoniae TaxID=573 RepID=UPI0038538D6D
GTRVASATYSPDGQKGEARIIEAETSKEIARLARDDGSINTLAWSPDGRFLAMGGKTTVVVEASTGNQMSRLTHRGEALTLAWSPEGRWLAIGTAN